MFFNYQLDLGFQQLMGNQFATPSNAFASAERCALNSGARTLANDCSPFESLARYTSESMSLIQANRIDLDKTFSEKLSVNGRFTLTSQEWELTARRRSFATLRMVYIKGQKTEIINTWIFPKRSDLMPVYAAELISIGGIHRIAFVDIQVPGLRQTEADEVEFLTAPLATRFSVLPYNEPPPSWATDASQGNFAFARQADASWTATIQDCYCSYLETYLNVYATGATARSIASYSPTEEVTATLSEYQHHHMEHSPGNKFLSNLFGHEWTQSFLTNFVFAKP
jgi:15,16-dihydrobiliverdin:ferredoxin oxidoreductase